ncbi:hypothetical protein AC578_2332 [Pseudocercospora eumusae]|uniref:Uncharacterized protein n=1 Tax=Pseudocercospora eumusae TaxID=321146 RepID=A0A139HXR3_9PEZI|nr:hypothetical protein AC578_2332 [Pseudocercospora eumusae]
MPSIDHFDMSTFTGRDFLIRGQHVCQLILSLWGASLSYAAITKLRKYEATAKKLAEWSKEAENQLWKTRTTQATGALAVLASFIASFSLSVVPYTLPKVMRMTTSPALLILVLFARGHIKNYWAPKDGKNITRVPLPKMEEYNEAERQTERLLEVLEYLEYSWVLTSFVDGMVGY